MLKYFISAALIALSLLFPPNATAQNEFQTDFYAVYDIDDQGVATVNQNIKLTNLQANIYATQYALEIGSTRIESVVAFDNAGLPVDFKVTTTDNKTVIVATFDKKVVGKGQVLDFTVRYKNFDVSQKTGRILEINIPKVNPESRIDSYLLDISLPVSFGQPKIVTPKNFTTSQAGSKILYRFSDNQIMTQGLTAIFGQSQVFALDLTYNLENPTVSNAITQVALPPDTPYQKVYYDYFSKSPDKVEPDPDGNWIATFRLEPKERVSVKVTGYVVVYLDPSVEIPPPSAFDPKKYLGTKKYWNTTHPDIVSLAEKLKTPNNIYQYLVDNFTYNYDRINSGVTRLGSVDAIKYPDNAICTEFTDAFIAIARSAGIPAREVNGFAYTENSILKPLSLIQDVLHSWPEYFDAAQNRWIPIDPTWGNTTGNIDYFSHLDFNHVTFAIHGLDSERPYPAGYYKFDDGQSKDVELTFAEIEPSQNIEFNVDFSTTTSSLFSSDQTITATIRNQSNVALYHQTANVVAQGATILDSSQHFIDSLLPYQTAEIVLKLAPSQENPTIQLHIADQTYDYQIVETNRFRAILIPGISLGTLSLIMAFRPWRLLVSGKKRSSSLRR